MSRNIMTNREFVDNIAFKIVVSNTKLYILYDISIKKYIIRGCNYSSAFDAPNDEYSFECCDKTTMCDFISLIVSGNYATLSFLNYKKMFMYSQILTYKYLDTANCNKTNRRTISSKSYNFETIIDTPIILRYLTIIKDFANPY